jgi:hypothetical protein
MKTEKIKVRIALDGPVACEVCGLITVNLNSEAQPCPNHPAAKLVPYTGDKPIHLLTVEEWNERVREATEAAAIVMGWLIRATNGPGQGVLAAMIMARALCNAVPELPAFEWYAARVQELKVSIPQPRPRSPSAGGEASRAEHTAAAPSDDAAGAGDTFAFPIEIPVDDAGQPQQGSEHATDSEKGTTPRS